MIEFARVLFKIKAPILILIKMVTISLNLFAQSEERQPIVRYYLERSSSYSIDYHQATKKSCRLNFEPEIEFEQSHRQKSRLDEMRTWCSGEKLFYKFKSLSLTGCQWENLVPESPIKSLGPAVEKMKQALVIKNLEVVFRNKLMICSGDLLIPGSSNSVKIEGLCAPFETSKVESQGLSEYKNSLMLGVFKAKKPSNYLQKSIDSKLSIDKEKISLSMNVAIPIPRKIVQDINYLLSSQGQKKCEDIKSKRQISSR